MIEPIRIPDATREPAACVRALVDTLGDREPLEVLRQTPRRRAGHVPGAHRRPEVAGHDLAHRNQLARTVAAAVTHG
jgi:hypothetical protein